MININKLNTTSLNITTGSASHADTWYKYAGDTEWRTVSITGEIGGGTEEHTPTTQIPDVTNVVELEIGSDVTSIGYMAFSDCIWLTSVTIPNSVTSIGYMAFADCSGLTSVTIGNGVTSIGEGAFYECTGLTSVSIGNGVTSIGYMAFADCRGLTSVTFNSFTKNVVKTLTTSYYIFGNTSCDDKGHLIEKSFTAICTDGSMTIHFSANQPATITFTDL